MRVNTQALINTNIETEKSIKGSVLPVLERLNKEIKNKTKELSHGAQKSAKEVEKCRNATQKHIELLGQHTAAFEASGGRMHSALEDPYVIHRGVLHRLTLQVLEENNHRNDLIAVQNNFLAFETHVVSVVQQAMEAFNAFASSQAEKTRALFSDMLGAAQRIPPDFEWKQFLARSGDALENPNEDPRTVESIQFPNMDHQATRPLIEGSLERKSRNKLAWGTQTAYYVVTQAKFLHEFKDSDTSRRNPTPELSLYLPDAMIGTPSGDKFNIKGKDKAKTLGSKIVGSSELAFRAHSPADALKWFEVIRNAAGATAPGDALVQASPPHDAPHHAAHHAAPAAITVGGDGASEEKPKPVVAHIATPGATDPQHATQQSGVTGADAVSSPTAMSPVSAAPAAASTAPATEKNSVGTVGTMGIADMAPATAQTSAADGKGIAKTA